MLENFSFFIPSIDHLTDLCGLLYYLGQKIIVGFSCLYCNREFQSLPAVRQHMVDSGHCMMQWDDQTEYSEFYQFPKKETLAQCFNEIGELEETKLAQIDDFTGEMVLYDSNGNTKTLGLRQYRIHYKQRGHKYIQPQLTTSLMQEHKRLAAIEYEKRVRADRHFIARRNQFNLHVGIQQNQQKHYRDQNGMLK